jgi:hypothetical protein
MKEKLEAILSAYPDLTQAMVAEKLGVSRQRVNQICKQHGIVLRSGRNDARGPWGSSYRDAAHLYRIFDKDGVLLYVGATSYVLNRLAKQCANAVWFYSIKRIEVELHETLESALRAEAEAIQNEKPRWNISKGTHVYRINPGDDPEELITEVSKRQNAAHVAMHRAGGVGRKKPAPKRKRKTRQVSST